MNISTLETKSVVTIKYLAATSRKLWRFGNSSRNYNSDAVVFGHRPVKSSVEFKVSADTLENRSTNSNLYRLVTAFRQHGVKHANLDPLNLAKISRAPELWPESYGLRDMKEVFSLQGILNIGVKTANLEDIVGHLKKIYLGPIAFECHQLSNEEEREWFSAEIESMHGTECLAVEMRRNLAVEMLKSQIFDNFLASKFASLKRYGGEGAECMMAFFLEVFRKSAEFKYDEVILGMPHRGRLNILTGLLQYPPVQMFRKIKGYTEFPSDIEYSGDVLSHLTSSVDLEVDGHELHVTMLPNPSHLEAVNPVTVGKARGRQMTLGAGYYSPNDFIEKIVPLQIHGDAAFEAQGINMETLQLANVPHFTVGGSVHLIVNNQVGFTTPADRGRSTDNCSDLARMIFAPVIHVNGDYPEEVIKATTLAMNYRQRFRKDVFVDLYCYRRWGHNELDDPTFTNPVMYRAVSSKGTSPDAYANALKDAGILVAEDVDKIKSDYTAHLLRNFNEIDSFSPQASHLKGYWSEMRSPQASLTTWDTGIDLDLLRYVGAKSVELPKTFNVHPHLQKTFITNRIAKLTNGDNLDWATAEAAAFGSLLHQGFSVRLCGQDVGRGTFSHRHCMFVDYSSGSLHVPLNSIDANQAYLEVSNSILSEEAVLAFEYGMSVENPKRLVIWEAQFGDFFNGAQIIIDTFISSGEAKWLLQSGIVMLLPHGYDGAGPEHSSCRLERFLQMTDSKENAVDGDNVNFEVVNPTTPAQYFHLLRRQMVRNYRKPLAVVAPKVLLRLPAATSKPADFGPGTSFKRILDDTDAVPEKVERVIFCTGKHYYSLYKERENLGNKKTAIIRLESLCPFPTSELQKQMMKYTKAKSFIWSQEEHRNMGAWTFVAPRFENLVGCKLTYVGRCPLAAPAVAIGQLHQKEAVEVVANAFE